MSFTGKLGTSTSKLGNFKLASVGGGGGPTTYDKSISIDCTAAVLQSFADIILDGVTLASTASVVFATVASNALTIAGVARFTSPGGVVLANSLEIAGTSAIARLSGLAYSNSISIDGTASTAEAFIYGVQASISIDCTATADRSVDFVLANSTNLHVTSSLTIASAEDYVVNLTLNSISRIFNENLYENLIDVLVINTFTASSLDSSVPSELPASVASLSVNATMVMNRNVTQTFAMTQTAHRSPGDTLATQTYTITQHVIAQAIHIQNVTQTYAVTQTAYRVFPAASTITFVQAVVVKKVYVRQVNQTFTMSQSLLHPGTFSRSVTQTLNIVQGGIQHLPIVTTGPPLIYSGPPVYVWKAPAKCYVLLMNNYYALTLPCPQLGDTQDYLGTMNLQRTMTGETLTYVRRSRLNKLKYSFWLGRLKALEVEDFVFNYGDKPMNMTNWKGEQWIVNITNTPFEFVGKERYQPEGERYEVTFEFTGIKVGG